MSTVAPIAAPPGPPQARARLIARERELERRALAREDAMGRLRRRMVLGTDRGVAGAPRAAQALVRLGRELVHTRTELAVVRRALRRLDGELRAPKRC